MDNIQELCDSMIGISFDVRGEDYGRILRWVCVEKDGKTYHVFITSLGKKVEASSAIHYIKNTVRYPDGTDYVLRQRKIKRKGKGNGGDAFPATIRNRAYFSSNVMPKALPHERELNNKLSRKDK